MKIYYHGQGQLFQTKNLTGESDLILLTGNNWDDYGDKTTFNVSLYFDGKPFELELSIKILIEGSQYSAQTLNKLKHDGWDGFFPIPELNYISLPSDIDFYSTLASKEGMEELIKVAENLRDASYLVKIKKDEQAIQLVETDAFNNSMLRESGARKSFSDGWLHFKQDELSVIDDFTLNLITKENKNLALPFHFNSNILPYDINILIGSNGIGKSYCLKSLVEYWLGTGIGDKYSLEKNSHTPFDVSPNLSKLILISYSPFEEFRLDLSEETLQDKEAYKYFGFRKYNDETDKVGISRNLPAKDSVLSIIKAIYEDDKFNFIEERVKKFPTIKDVLSKAFLFDNLALKIDDTSIRELNTFKYEDKNYIIIDDALPSIIEESNLLSYISETEGVIFFKNGELLKFSSGQRLFTYIVINVMGELRENSLVVIDEPELFLHPTLEIEFISLLKLVLEPFRSKAILATHSLTTVREIPSSCVHIMRDEGYGVEFVKPPFETFGGDMQRISSYVFGDESVTKPFDKWIDSKLAEYQTPDALISALGKEINEEILIKILNSEANYGH